MPRYSYSLQPDYSEQGYSELDTKFQVNCSTTEPGFKLLRRRRVRLGVLPVECRAQPQCFCGQGPAGLARSAVSRWLANL